MFHALMLSPDDQAVAAITGVLEEMSVTCERPLDGVSAAKKLNSHSFDLVLVDCENLPAAKLIFDVCRRGSNGHNPVPIAIVDGRAGLPTAFRLGAELILTKPVAKDQARNTIRSAVGRVRKDAPGNESAPASLASGLISSQVVSAETKPVEPMTVEATTSAVKINQAMSMAAAAATTSVVKTEAHAQAAATAVSQQTAVAEPAPSVLASSSPADSVATFTPVIDEQVVDQVKNDERVEKDEQVEKQLEQSNGSSETATSEPAKPAVGASAAKQPDQKKKRGPLVALLALTIAVGAFYAAWEYQPGFRTIVRTIAQPQIDRALALVGMALPSTSTPSARPAPPTVAAAKPAAVGDPSQQKSSAQPATASPSADPTKDSSISVPSTAITTGSPTTSTVAANASVASAVSPNATVAPQSSRPGIPVTPASGEPGGIKKDAAAELPSSAKLAESGSAIILSSKGAEKRLAHRVPPKYPTAGLSEAEGTIVLKAVVDESGKVADLRLVEGNATLATSAIEAVKQWRYRPYVRDGKTLPFQTVVIVDFQRP